MEINATHSIQQTSLKQTALEGNVPDSKVIAGRQDAVQDNDADDSSRKSDTVSFSAASLKLAQPAEKISTLPAIDDAKQAQKAAEQVAAEIRNYPPQAQDSYGNVANINLQSLLG